MFAIAVLALVVCFPSIAAAQTTTFDPNRGNITLTSNFDFVNAYMFRGLGRTNRLQPLGKKRAITELQEFLKVALPMPFAVRDPANIDTSDSECVLLIVRLLFEPSNPSAICSPSTSSRPVRRAAHSTGSTAASVPAEGRRLPSPF